MSSPAIELSMQTWSAVLLAFGTASMIGCLIGLMLAKAPSFERRCYWSCWLVGGAIASASLILRGVGLALVTYGALVIVAIIWAFFRTNFMKVGGRIVAATPADRCPDVEK